MDLVLIKTWHVNGRDQHAVERFEAHDTEQVLEHLGHSFRVQRDHPAMQPSLEAVATGKLFLTNNGSGFFYRFELHVPAATTLLLERITEPDIAEEDTVRLSAVMEGTL